MWDTAETMPTVTHLPHDMQCVRCGHPGHTYLPCSDSCACVPSLPPGVYSAGHDRTAAA